MGIYIQGVEMPKGDVTSLLIEITREGVATCEVFRDDTADGHSEGWAVEIVEVEEPHGPLIDAADMLVDESEAYMSAQLNVPDEATRLVNEVVHKKIQRLIIDTPAVIEGV